MDAHGRGSPRAPARRRSRRRRDRGLEYVAEPRRLRDTDLVVQPRVAQVGRYEQRRDVARREGAAEADGDARTVLARRRAGDQHDPLRLATTGPAARPRAPDRPRPPGEPAATALRGQHHERGEAGQRRQLARALDPRREHVAAERREHGDEQSGEEGEQRVLDRSRRIRRVGGARPPAICSSSPVATSLTLSSLSRSRAAPSRPGESTRGAGAIQRELERARASREALALGGRAQLEERARHFVGDRGGARRVTVAGLDLDDAGDVVDCSRDLLLQRVRRLAGQVAGGAARTSGAGEQRAHRRQAASGAFSVRRLQHACHAPR